VLAVNRIHVVAGIVLGADQRIFISRRADHLHQGGLWEFPGGKVEAGEEADAALARELFEEIDIYVTQSQPYMQVQHDYVDKKVLLDIWQVDSFSGIAQGKEGQQCRWISLADLLSSAAAGSLLFPAGNQPILQRLRADGLKT